MQQLFLCWVRASSDEPEFPYISLGRFYGHLSTDSEVRESQYGNGFLEILSRDIPQSGPGAPGTARWVGLGWA